MQDLETVFKWLYEAPNMLQWCFFLKAQLVFVDSQAAFSIQMSVNA